MEDSFKGLLITLTIVGLFITAILSFIVLFPQEQGVPITDLKSEDAYLTINNSKDFNQDVTLNNIQNSSQNAFNEWDITQGFMGSNTIKQGASTNVNSYTSNIFAILQVMATKLFGSGSPIVYAIGVILSLSLIVIIYMIYTLVRQGR